MTDDELRQLILDQREEMTAPSPTGRWIPRTREASLRESLRRPLIKVIMGVRRCGKSVLARLALAGQNVAYVNFDDERLAMLKREDLHRVEKVIAALSPSAPVWLLDEVQNIDGWELFVNRLHRAGHNLVITGSNSKLLSRELSTHLTGRYIPIELFPFSFGEFLNARGAPAPGRNVTTRDRARLEERLREYAVIGGFPDIVLSGPSDTYLRELHDKIVSRDIATRYRVKHPRILKELSLHCFANPASSMTYHRVQRTFGIPSVHTAGRYAQFLEEAYLVLLARPFSLKSADRVRQPWKVYTIDNGLTDALSIKVTQDRGALLENLVFQELRRRDSEVFHWTRPDHAVDFLVRDGRRVARLIQVCADLGGEETIRREYRGLQKASQATGCRDLMLLTPDGTSPPQRLVPSGPRVRVEPLWRWLLDLV